jgi:PTS system mannose-specific IIB component
MAIELVRIDDRLIHGQVVTTWVKQYQIEQILIINDEISQDEVQKNVFNVMAPDNVKVQTFGVEKFAEIYKKTPIKRRTLLLLTNPIDVTTLVENDVDILSLNVGGMKFTGNRKRYTRAVSLTEEEKMHLLKLAEKGIDIGIQMVPTDKKLSVDELKKGGE